MAGRRRGITTLEGGAAPPALTDDALLLVTGEGTLSTHTLCGQSVVIGRADDCDVVVAHGTLSRRHACLRLQPTPTIQDLGSTNGTRVGEQLLKGGDPAPFAVGDAFYIGRFAFVLLHGLRDVASGSPPSNASQAFRVVDPTFESASALLHDLARSNVNVLILGETGVGKEVLADTVHRLSARRGPLVSLNCAALSPQLLESELFGHEKGAFTGANQPKTGLLESAQGGTVFLDEVGELPTELQAKLLRALENREVLRVGAVRPRSIDVRFVAATNCDLPEEVARGRFRADLFFRLDGVTLAIPPLRERRHLIAPLALRFLAAAGGGATTPTLAPAVLQKLEAHSWPGNVRELKAVIERTIILARGQTLVPHHVVLRPLAPSPTRPLPADDAAAAPSLAPDEQRQRAQILEALEACAGNQTRAAQQLGISRATLVTRLRVYRIPRPRK